MPKDSKGSTGLSYTVDRKKEDEQSNFCRKKEKISEIWISRD